MTRKCEVCERAEGSTLDRSGEEDGMPLPLERCDLCHRLVCCDCLGEADCCFAEEDEHLDDPNWAPPGWIRVPSSVGWWEYHRLAD